MKHKTLLALVLDNVKQCTSGGRGSVTQHKVTALIQMVLIGCYLAIVASTGTLHRLYGCSLISVFHQMSSRGRLHWLMTMSLFNAN